MASTDGITARGRGMQPGYQRRRSFGADDLPDCPRCGNLMSLTRRGPHSDYGAGWERQTFACRACRHEVERSVDADGTPHR